MKPKKLSYYKKKLDKTFSDWVRLKDHEGGYAICFTCGKKDIWKYLQAGHFVPRQHLNTRWSEVNVHVQCVGCNVFKKGNMDVYAVNLQKKYGQNILIELQKRKNTIKKYTITDLKKLIEYYTEEIKSL